MNKIILHCDEIAVKVISRVYNSYRRKKRIYILPAHTYTYRNTHIHKFIYIFTIGSRIWFQMWKLLLFPILLTTIRKKSEFHTTLSVPSLGICLSSLKKEPKWRLYFRLRFWQAGFSEENLIMFYLPCN